MQALTQAALWDLFMKTGLPECYSLLSRLGEWEEEEEGEAAKPA